MPHGLTKIIQANDFAVSKTCSCARICWSSMYAGEIPKGIFFAFNDLRSAFIQKPKFHSTDREYIFLIFHDSSPLQLERQNFIQSIHCCSNSIKIRVFKSCDANNIALTPELNILK